MTLRWDERSLPGRGLRLHARVVVEPAGEPILLLHGLGVSGAVWQAFARRLAPRFAAVAPDLRGHGQSDAPPDGFQPTDYAADLAEAIDELSQGGAIPVVGHSLGALAALALAEGWPERVPWLVLLDPPLDAGRVSTDIPVVYRLRHERVGTLEAYLLEINPGGGPLLARMLATAFHQASDAAFEAMLAAPAGQPDAWRRAPSVRQPCLLVQADPARGGRLGDQAARDFVARLPAGQLLRIADAPHAVHASHPAEVAQAILRLADRG